MKILGINHDMYITSAALIVDGKIMSAVAEERFNREKQSRRFPANAINYCLQNSNLKITDIDYIANSYNPSSHLNKFNPIFSNSRRSRYDYLYSIPDNLLNLFPKRPLESEFMSQEHKFDKYNLKIYFINHHLCHAANGFYLSPFNEASILTADGRGENDTATFSYGKKNKIETLNNMKIPHSLGSFYSTFTSFLGFKPDSDEWKVMALSSYGSKSNNIYKKLKKLIEFKSNGTFELDTNYFSEINHEMPEYYSENFLKLLGKPRKKNDNITNKHYEIAAAMQQVTEDILFHMCDKLYNLTKSNNLVLSGGSVMNSVFNGKILENSSFKNLFISSAPDDSGLSIGAGLALYNHILGKKKRFVQTHNYYGPEFSNQRIKKILDELKIKYLYSKNIEKYAANALSNGKLIAWFQGRMEFGQRALGNRSILADPRNKNMKKIINKAIKFRESFRPFAPAILIDHVKNYFEIDGNQQVPFMEKVLKIKKHKQKDIPAVTHKDGSGRLQTVDKKNNQKFYSLINEFYKLTSIPVVLNTSFNVNNEPIVCTPQDAIRNFNTCGLDILIMGNYIITKKN